MANASKGQFSVMPKKLAEALLEHGVQHFDIGGGVGGGGGGGSSPFGGGGGNNQAPSIFGMRPTSNFQATAPTITTQNFLPQIGMQEQQENTVFQQQANLAQQLLAQANGQGPGQTLVAQQAGKNAAQQGALMASQRGASANAGLIGRQAAMAGAEGNQQAVNAQAALALQSQGALAQQQNSMANQALQAQSILQGANAAQNAVITQGQLGAEQLNQQTAAGNAHQISSIFGGMSNGAGGALTSLLYKGGTAGMANGGPVNDNIGIANYQSGGIGLPLHEPAQTMSRGGMSFGQMLAGGNVPGKAKVSGDSKENDTVPTMLSPGEDVIPRSITQLPEKEMEQKAVEFLRHLHKGKKGYGAVLDARKRKV